MGTLADVLNETLKTKIGGQEFAVRHLGAGRIYTHIEAGLREIDPKIRGMELQKMAQQCIKSGRYPVQAIAKFLFDGSDDLDEKDAEALTIDEYLEEAMAVARWIVGLTPTIKKKEIKPKPKTTAK